MIVRLLAERSLSENSTVETASNKKFGRYEIIAELGRGAMGIVYKARDPQIGRLVALKTILLQGADPEKEAQFRKRFLCEAQAAGRLQHPGLVAIYDTGEEQQTQDPYIVLEFVNGESLNKVLAREKKLPVLRALQLGEEIAEALDYAHEQGVVHRDIKPANILIDELGHAKIADFGIAQLNIASFSLPGQVMGTPAYMAPEQLSGQGVDGRSDIFSLGVLMYAMVTGHSAFHGNSATTICFKVVNRDPVPASAFDLRLPRGLDSIIARAMAKDPANRYQRAGEMSEELKSLRNAIEQGTVTGITTSWNLAPGTNLYSFPSTRTDADLAQARQAAAQLKRSRFRDILAGAAVVLGLVLLAFSSRRAGVFQPLTAVQTPAPAQDHPQTGPQNVLKEQNTALSSGVVASENAASTPLPTSTTPAIASSKQEPVARIRTVKSSSKSASASAARPVASSTLEVSVDHQFKQATLTLWVDDELKLTRVLHGGSQKKLIVFKATHGAESESLQVPSGTHQIRVRVQSSDQTVDLSRTVTGSFSEGEDKTLQVTFEKHNSVMRLAWQ
jgi:serine/threonine protein kinase